MNGRLAGAPARRQHRGQDLRELVVIGEREPEHRRLAGEALGQPQPRRDDHHAPALGVERGQEIAQPARHGAVLELEVEVEQEPHQRTLAVRGRARRAPPRRCAPCGSTGSSPRVRDQIASARRVAPALPALEGGAAERDRSLLLVGHHVDDARAGAVELGELLHEGHGHRSSVLGGGFAAASGDKPPRYGRSAHRHPSASAVLVHRLLEGGHARRHLAHGVLAQRAQPVLARRPQQHLGRGPLGDQVPEPRVQGQHLEDAGPAEVAGVAALARTPARAAPELSGPVLRVRHPELRHLVGGERHVLRAGGADLAHQALRDHAR